MNHHSVYKRHLVVCKNGDLDQEKRFSQLALPQFHYTSQNNLKPNTSKHYNVKIEQTKMYR